MKPTTQNSTSDTLYRIGLRLPPALAARLRALAQQHHRSLNGEMVEALTWYVAQHTAHHQAPSS